MFFVHFIILEEIFIKNKLVKYHVRQDFSLIQECKCFLYIKKKKNKQKEKNMPPGRACPICGRMFGTSSLDIHIPQCQKKTIIQWKNDPNTRDRPLPSGLAMLGTTGLKQQQQQQTSSSSRGGGQSLPTGPSSLASKMGGGGGFENRSAVAGGKGAAMTMGAGSGMPLNLVDCRYCGRHFSSDRIGKHENVCIGSKASRQAFDTKSQRLSELMGEMMPSAFGSAKNRRPGGKASSTSASRLPPSTSSYAPKRDWRREHQEFQQMIRAAKTDAVRTAPPPPQRHQQQPQRSSYGGVASSTNYSARTSSATAGRRAGPTTTSSTRATAITSGSGPRGAGFVARNPATRSTAGGGGFSNFSGASGGGGSNLSGTRIAGGGGGGGYVGGGTPQVGIAPTNDTSAGMWAAMGREQPKYGSYGPIGRRSTNQGGGGGGSGNIGASNARTTTSFW